ncbi:MAG: hypothetical protein RBS05_18810 [Zoogloea oleivorans]|jgi:hypothetical protein|uniref:hypothetical protein n=1 Tax=Zoogloea oleivorans TaxID=1552750 RepID=UPI002A35EC81|nr:hypothetical protein [Zoogloea oleivorans]MDY0037967.1 hypothetical protein [Zoogloea oleivorans]
MVNLPELAERLHNLGLLNKPFVDCTRSEIVQVVESVFSSVGEDVPENGWKLPKIDDKGDLFIPIDVHPAYRWWTPAGKSIREILVEIGAPYAVAKRYIDAEFSEDDWNYGVIPF